jgi:hypothetical protein
MGLYNPKQDLAKRQSLIPSNLKRPVQKVAAGFNVVLWYTYCTYFKITCFRPQKWRGLMAPQSSENDSQLLKSNELSTLTFWPPCHIVNGTSDAILNRVNI